MVSGERETESRTTAPRERNRAEIQRWMMAEMAKLLKVEVKDVDVQREFSSFGLESLTAFSLTGQLSEWLNRDLSATLLWEYPTIASLADYLAGPVADPKTHTRRNSVRLAGREPQPRLFAICGIEVYQSLANRLAGTVSTYGVYVPPEKELGKFGAALDDRYHYDNVEDLAAQYSQEILEVDGEGPYALLGLSFGGILAFEVAHQLRRAGRDVAFVALLDSVVVRALKKRAYRHVIDFVKSLRVLGRRATVPVAATEGSPTPDELAKYRGRYYWTLSKGYTPEPFAGQVILVRAAQSKLFGRGYVQDVYMGWRDLVSGDLYTVTIDCPHTGMLQPPHVETLVEVLRPRFGAVRSGTCS
jgi:thioesterase domain-containing protein/acyl carrier protein